MHRAHLKKWNKENDSRNQCLAKMSEKLYSERFDPKRDIYGKETRKCFVFIFLSCVPVAL